MCALRIVREQVDARLLCPTLREILEEDYDSSMLFGRHSEGVDALETLPSEILTG